MGDKIEIVTFPKQFNMFYRVSSSALMFEVKSPGFVGLGLSSQPLPPCNVWVGIGCSSDRTWIGKPYENHKEINTPNILSKDEYRSFLITWNNDYVKLFRKGDQTLQEDSMPLLTYKINTANIMYITFNVAEQGTEPAYWRFELPPLINKSSPVPVKGGDPEWVQANTQLPDDTLVGGYEKEPLYIMRAPHNGSLTPGKFVPSEGLGYIPWGGEAHEKSDFEVLRGYNCTWEKTFSNKLPTGAVIAGRSEDRRELLYVGRAEHNGYLIPGKVQPSHRVCYIAFEDREISKSHYEILVAADIRCANKVYNPQLMDITLSARYGMEEDIEIDLLDYEEYSDDSEEVY